MLKDGVVIGGLGVVGTATRNLFGIKDYFDKKESTVTLKEIAAEKRYVFLALPTPAVDDGYEWMPIMELIKQIEQFPGGQKVYIVRSTLIPGTCEHMMDELGIDSIIHNPEFLTMRTRAQDTYNPDIVVIGGRKDNYLEDVKKLYKEAIRNSGREISSQYFLTDTTTSEFVKLAVNNLYALKVVFANQMYDIAEKVGADYDMAKVIMYARKWIGKNHLTVWHDKKRGYAGKCLPKDIDATIGRFHPELIETAKKLNQHYLRQKRAEDKS